ncbi:heavy metal translocating P-type ATPase [Chitinophaga horti]|uniref:Heavy metal translocating P-type ATPase n=1 Tax=Chitinophaga horti TaxID=2920382 RepID=A0ABY6J6J5_9BACT|nr:heavy metal translocating P-type ATPase [Chitinophaga horti]UYQ95298.1 heavy metal translocating P-type ATPase [Chitinophaga horti]
MAQHLIKETFPVLEMSCAACAASVESTLKASAGVKDAGVNFANQDAWVMYDDRQTNPETLQAAIRSVGYDLLIDTEDREEKQAALQKAHYQQLKQRTWWAIALSFPVVVIGMFFMNMPYANWIMLALSSPVVIWLGRGFFVNAWKQARHGKANMDTLVALSTGIAYLFSLFNTLYPQYWHQRGLHAHVYFEAAAVIIAFISLGKLMEERAKSNTSSALKKLMGLQPKTVLREQADGSMVEVAISDVKVNDILLVKPGEKIPVDGALVAGSSYVDESTITGEPIAAAKTQGDKVFAGTLNQQGSFRMKAEKVGANTVLAQIIKMVKEAQGSKAPVQQLADRIAGIFVPVVMGIAVLTFGLWMILGGDHAFTHALLAAITVLVIACPCALGLATPTAIMVGVGKGADHNILIRDAESLENARKVNAVILDKTGTITEGRPVVTDLTFQDERYKSLLLAMELQSEHPLASALVKRLEQEGVRPVKLDNMESITGKGVQATYEGITYKAGNSQLITPDAASAKIAASWQQEAKTVIYFSADEKVVAMAAIADKVKERSAQAIATLQSQGIEVYMLTGDNAATAAAVAKQTGIRHYEAEVLPARKAQFVQELQAAGKVVAMAGDGINDSQALAQADVSIAMGKGSDIAMDVAKMTLITADLNSIPKALALSRATVRTIRQNLFWAFIYNLIGIPLAAGILYPVNGFLLDPMIAGAAMALSSVSVVSNSLLLKIKQI